MAVSPVPAAVSRGPRPAEVHDLLRRHLITDGLDLVLDLGGSHGAWIRCARTGREFLDCFSYFATNPVGHNHPGVTEPAFVERLGRVAVHNPSNSD
ncbi:MAG: L-lysine 6-transaminase, partial [Acidobacteria bacterium]|nr:L-lysine 6-transaminase [Acidobacteriota bacterium]